MKIKFWRKKKEKKSRKVHLISSQGIPETQQTKLQKLLETKGIKAVVTPYSIQGAFVLDE